MRRLALAVLLAAVWAPAANGPQAECALAVEFPYYMYPPSHWERELVWLKTIGVRTVAFSIPWNWHEVEPGVYDFNGRTSPRRNLSGFIHTLHRLGLYGWVRPIEGWPVPARVGGEAAWSKQLRELLAPQTVAHGGPIAFVEGLGDGWETAPAPSPVAAISDLDPHAFELSREALAKRQVVLWRDVEDTLYPAGWEPIDKGVPLALLRKGAVGLNGEESGAVAGLRREAAWLRSWEPLLGAFEPSVAPHSAFGKLPESVTTAELISPVASVIQVENRGTAPFHDDLRVFEPVTKRPLVVTGVNVPGGESLWLPLSISLAQDGLCRECSNFTSTERLVYATAELLSVEYENGILAMEFTAPVPAEAILQLEHEPIGPYLAGGRPIKFEWDEKTLRVRLPIPAGTGADHHVRVGLAIEEPENSAFFNELHRLVIGQPNPVETSYSSAELAARSRLRLPEGYTATSSSKSPEGIDYTVTAPGDAAHGDFALLALEADGMPLGRARVQLFRPVSVRLPEAIRVHFGQTGEMPCDPPVVTAEPKAGTDLDIIVRNNWPAIQTFRVEPSGKGLEFSPRSSEVNIGPIAERHVSVRVFAADGASGLRDALVHVTGAGGGLDLPLRVVLQPRNHTMAWSADLYDDGSLEWILESPAARAVFSTQDGGRWMEFTCKAINANFLPAEGGLGGVGPVEVRAAGDALEFTGRNLHRTVRLEGGVLSIEQDGRLPVDNIQPVKRGNLTLKIEHPAANRAIYSFE